MVETALAFAVALLSGLVPVLNIEVYLVGAAVAVDSGPLLGTAMAVAAGAGQTLGKLPYYYAGRGTLSLRWMHRRKNDPGRWSERVARWRRSAEARPLWGAGLVALSSFASVPPFMAVCVLAGTVRMNVVVFSAITMVTRTARFLLLVLAPGWAMDLLPG
ncbi:membrane protein [Nocardiopsis sp. CNT312]|uniref:membrane protein n=1 Tax=Nocardiopsis sp. CNT312 TaxID=1137268 RepID=UPI00048C1ED4|nr:membrane protein [Nocardiopsis sp. CNT312]